MPPCAKATVKRSFTTHCFRKTESDHDYFQLHGDGALSGKSRTQLHHARCAYLFGLREGNVGAHELVRAMSARIWCNVRRTSQLLEFESRRKDFENIFSTARERYWFYVLPPSPRRSSTR
jgi:hypothetical protein